MPAGNIDVCLVTKLIKAQFPQWAGLPIIPVEPGGWDNRSFRLGEDLVVRLPSAACYSLQVEKEQRWLPVLAPELPLPIPRPAGFGRSGEGYPWDWSVYKWLPGETAAHVLPGGSIDLARSLAAFLKSLHQIGTRGGPKPGPHSFWRGAPLEHYDPEVRSAIAGLGRSIDAKSVTILWDAAVDSRWQDSPVWIHGDLASDNLLLNFAKLSAVIDFGCCGIGDPACDLAVGWSYFDRNALTEFQKALPLDGDTWIRGRGWALWKALVTIARGAPKQVECGRRTLARILA